MRQITVTVGADRKASAPKDAEIIMYNSDYTIIFDIAEGSGFNASAPITAIFTTRRGKQKVDFTGGCCAAPVFIGNDGITAYVGLTQGEIKTTTAARIRLKEAILTYGGADADPADMPNTPLTSTVDPADIINVNDVSAGAWVRATINTLAACIAELIGGGGGDSYWSLVEGLLVPVRDLNLDGNEIIGAAEIILTNGTVPWTISRLSGEPSISTVPVRGIGSIIKDTTTGKYFICAGSTTTIAGVQWIWHEVVLDVDDHEFARGATYAICEQLPATATWREYIQRLTGWYAEIAKIADKQDKSNLVTSLSSSSTDTQYPSAKCVYDAIIGAIEGAY